MKVLLALVVLVLVALAAFALVRAVLARRAERARRSGRWTLDEDPEGENVCVYAVHPARERLLIGAVPFAAADFDFRIEELRAEGMHKVAALNAGPGTVGTR